jgi:hypothetical protein
MSFNNIAYPQFIFVQATEPTDKTQGKLWYKTTENALYKSNGISYSILAESTQYLNTIINENTLSILDLQAIETLTGGQSAYMIRDIYTDTTGYLNTINIGATNATYTADTPTTNAHGIALDDINSVTAKRGITILFKADGILVNATKSGDSAATKGYLLRSTGETIIGATSFVGNVVTFNYPVHAGETIVIAADAAGGSYNSDSTSGIPSVPNSTTNGYIYQYGGTKFYEFDSFNFSGVANTYANGGADKIVTTTAATIAAGSTKFQIFTLGSSLSGDGNITYDVSFDNGAHYQTAVIANVQTAITTSGTQLILKQNLNKGAGAGTASAKGFAIMFW